MRRREAQELLRRAATHAEQRAASESYDVEPALARFEREIRPEQAVERDQERSVAVGDAHIAPVRKKTPAVQARRPKKSHPALVMQSWSPFAAALTGALAVASALIVAAILLHPGSRPPRSVGLRPPPRPSSWSGAPSPKTTEGTPGAGATPSQSMAPDSPPPTPPLSSAIDPHTYYLIENAGTGSCLSYDWISSSVGPGRCADRAETDGWRYYMPQPDGTFQLVNEVGPYCLGEQSMTDRAPIVEPCGEAPGQLWRFGYANAKGTSFVNVESGRCLAAGESGSSGTVELKSCDTQPKELWLNDGTL